MKDHISIRKGKTSYFLHGKEVSEEEYRAVYPLPAHRSDAELMQAKSCSAWPMLSDALAVHPKQIQEAMERDAKRGVQTDYAEDGRAILRDRDHRRRLMKSLGMHDNNGGFGDG